MTPTCGSNSYITRNDSLYEIGGKYRYVEYRYKKSQRQHTVASLEIDEALATLLNTAADGATIEQLVQALVDDEITTEQAHEYVIETIASQVLKSELDPCVVGEDVLDTLIDKLSRLQMFRSCNRSDKSRSF